MILEILFSVAMAQSANIKDIPVEGDTTISVTKGGAKSVNYEISEGSAEITGDPEILTKEARSSWKKACDDWKKETKELNTENKILVLNCNSPKCDRGSAGETTCTSSGTYKVRVKMKE